MKNENKDINQSTTDRGIVEVGAIAIALSLVAPFSLAKTSDEDYKESRSEELQYPMEAEKRMAKSLRADKLMDVSYWEGMRVSSSDGEAIGRVQDAVLDLETGEVSHILLDNQGMFTGSRLLAVSEVGHGVGESELQWSGSATEYEAGPMYSKSSDKGNSSLIESNPATDMKKSDQRGLSANQVFCSDLVGRDVVSSSGDEIGEIESIIQIPNTLDAYAIVEDLETDDWDFKPNVEKVALRVPSLMVSDEVVELSVAGGTPDFESAPIVKDGDVDQWYLHNGYDIIVISEDTDEYAAR
ncbi:PRC-barrel domain-containing protein [Pelagicoccus sp. SDUM812002]|uniref:PRC-barrel domain-containing protein n=1 Tax=Pelagicoccus sp. SDUM812002 TaxID=3041266 RepID=UPI002810830C|nr:PRC-barrel domain-containing protein [Pelagicoccus sp. SDUM812002]MDQ8187606.1 PRC-barrel domain-containing protein [Pelagicoccus sp. SDUM812002]